MYQPFAVTIWAVMSSHELDLVAHSETEMKSHRKDLRAMGCEVMVYRIKAHSSWVAEKVAEQLDDFARDKGMYPGKVTMRLWENEQAVSIAKV